MNKSIVLVLAFFILMSVSGMGAAAEITVKPGASIQDSINSATSGDTIIVKPGTYTENIKIVKDGLTIRSETRSPEDTIIKAKSSSANVFLLQVDKVKIEGFEISGASKYGCAGIFLSACSDCAIENNKLSGNSFGISLLNSKDNTISKNTVSDCQRGIYSKYSRGNTLSGNTATGNKEYGIALEGSESNTLSGNSAFKNERGVYLGTSDGNTLKGNTIKNNKVYGFTICGRCDKCFIYNNYFNDTTIKIGSGSGNAYSITKTVGTNIVGGPYIAGSKYSDAFPLVIVTSKPPAQTPPAQTTLSANFWGSPRSGKSPLKVQFTDISTGKPTTWKWSFGDSTYSTQQNPIHTYNKAGKYTVSLTVKNAKGSKSITKSGYIVVK
jgi:parallel beta-helix repeat protein